MSTSIFSLTLNNLADAAFRAWGSALSAQIGSILTRVTQSNDINWTTVVKPTSSGNFQGGEVFRFNDSLQSTAPLFLLIEYGAGGSSGNTTGLRLTVGKSADGAGNIGGVLFPATAVVTHQTTPTTGNTCYVSGGASWFALSLMPSEPNGGGLLMLERSVVGGVPTGEALLVGYAVGSSATPSFRFIDYPSTASETVTSGIVAMPLSLSTDRSIANGTTTPVFPAACISPAGLFWRPRVLLGTARQNAGLGQVITSLIDGNTYLSLGAGSTRSDQRGGSFATTLIRWD